MIFTAKLREFKILGAVLGYCDAASSVTVPDGTEPPPANAMIYKSSAHPGCMAPNLWLGDGSSLYDHFGKGFTLLGTEGDCAREQFLLRLGQCRLACGSPQNGCSRG